MVLDLLVNQRLRVAGIVAFIVAVLAIADHIEHHVFVESLAVIERQLHRGNARFRIIAVHVKDRRLNPQRDVGAIHGRPRLVRIGGEPDLVVDHHMDGPAGGVAFHLAEVQHFRDDPLPRHRGIAVDQHRNHALAFGIAQAVLLGANDPFDHWIHSFQMTGIRGHRDRNLLATRHPADAARAQVILHVARALGDIGIDIALEFRKNLRHALADHVGEHRQPTAMRHADHDLMHAGRGRALQQLLDHGDGGFAAFNREALMPLEAVVQESFESVGQDNVFQNAPLRGRVEGELLRGGFHAFLNPFPLFPIVDVHELHARLGGIGLAQPVEQRAQRQHAERFGMKGAIQIPDGQPVRRRFQIRMRRARQTQRIDIRHQVPAFAPGMDEPRDTRLFKRIGADHRSGR